MLNTGSVAPSSDGEQHSHQRLRAAMDFSRAEDATAELQFRTLAKALPQLVWTCGPDGQCEYLSQQWVDYTGVPEDRQLGEGWLEQVHPDDRTRLLESWSVALRTQAGFRDEVRIRRHDGSYRWFEARAVPFCDAEGRVVRWFGSTTDIHEARQRQEDSRVEKLAAIGRLAAGVAHDFNNILMAITGHANLAGTSLTEDHPAAENIAQIVKAASRGAAVVKQMLAFGGAEPVKRCRQDLCALLEECCATARRGCRPDVAIETELRAPGAIVVCDAALIQQAIGQLLTNALDAIGDRPGRIGVRLERAQLGAETAQSLGVAAGHYVRVVVHDDGAGMSAATVARAFDPFFSTKPVGRGSGLGLSVVHGVVTSHGGAIALTSAPGAGTTFELYLPAEDSLVEASHRGARPARAGRILYVDDEPALVQLARRVIKRLGHQVVGFVDATEALAAFRASPDDFDVLVTDVSMPMMSGFELARAVRELRPDMPVIVTSGYVRPEDEDAARELGVQGLLSKPNLLDVLARAIERVLTSS